MAFFLLDFLKHLGNDLKKFYDGLKQDEKLSLANGTGLMEIFNENADKAPAEIRALIKTKFPTLDESKLEAALFEVANILNLSHDNNLDTLIEEIKAKVNSLDGKGWAFFSHIIATGISVFLAPAETKVSAITNLIEWFYQHFFKKVS